MNIEAIASITSTALLIIFIIIIALLLLSAFIGFKNGIWRTSFRMAYFAILFVLAVCMLQPLTSLLGQFPVGNFTGGVKTIVLHNSTSGLDYYVPITTLTETVQAFFRGYYRLFGIVGSSAKAAELAKATAFSVVKLIALAASSLLIILLGWILEVILWHAVFKNLIPKLARKNIKLHWVSMIQNMVTYIGCTFMLISPLTSIVNALNSSYQKHNTGGDSTIIATLDTFLNAYNSSMFAKAFFNWTTDASGLTIDSKIVNEFTKCVFDNTEIGIVETVSSITSIGSLFTGAIVDNGNSIGIDTGAIASVEVITELFDCIRDSDLLVAIIPIAAELAMNEQLLSSVVDPKLIDIKTVDWDKELDNLETLVLDIVNSGILTNFVDENGNFVNFNNVSVSEIIESCLTAQSFKKMEHALKTIDDSKLMSSLIPAIIYKLANDNASVGSFLPNSFDELCDISWGFELSTTLEVIHDIYLANPDVLRIALDATGKKSLSPLRGEEPNGTDSKNELLQFLIKDIDLYKQIIIGETDANNEPINLDENGRTIVYENGKRISGRKYCLFDLEISKFLINPILSFVNNGSGSSSSDPEPSGLLPLKAEGGNELEDLINELSSGVWKLNYKKEFNAIFNILAAFQSNPESVSAIVSGQSIIPEGGTLADIDKDLIKCFARALPRMDDSKILSTLIFPQIKDALLGQTVMDSLGDMGIDTDLIKAGVENAEQEHRMGYELAKILRVAPSLTTIQDSLSGGTPAEIITKIGENSEDIAYLLDAFFSCKIINPSKDSQIVYNEHTYRVNENYFNLLQYIFGDALTIDGISFKENEIGTLLTWENSKNSDGEFYHDKYGQPIYTGENGAIANVLKVIADSGIISVIDDPDFFKSNANLASLADESGYNLPGILAAVDSSKVFAATMGDFLDTTLADMHVVGTAGVTFNNVTDWKEEGIRLANVLKTVGDAEISLSELNLSSINDVVGFNNILHALVDSSIFVQKQTGEFLFGKWLFYKITDADNGLCKLYDKYNLVKDPDHENWKVEWENYDNYQLPPEGFENYRVLYNDLCGLDDPSDWYSATFTPNFNRSQYVTETYPNYYENPAFYNTYSKIMQEDELGRLVELAYWARKALDNITSPIDMDSATFNGLAESFNRARCLRIGVYNLYETAKQAINENDTVKDFFDLTPAYTSYLVNCDMGMSLFDESYEARLVEINYLEDVFLTYRMMVNKGILIMEDNALTGTHKGDFVADNIDLEFSEQMRKSIKGVNTSLVFHRKGSSVRVEGSDAYYPTAFQNMISAFFLKTDMKEIIYSENNPKDVYYSTVQPLYEPNVNSKVDYLVDTNFDWTDANNIEGGNRQLKEIDNIFNVVDAIVGGPTPDGKGTYTGLKKFDSKKGEYVATFSFIKFEIKLPSNVKAVNEILTTLNDTETLYDCVPNSVYLSLTEGNISTQFTSLDKVDFKDTNLFYHYFDSLNTHGESPYNWKARFTDANDEGYEEGSGKTSDIAFISQLMEQAALYASDIPEEHNKSVITSFDSLSTANIPMLEEFLTNMVNSKVFHSAGPRKTIDNTGQVIFASSTPKTVLQEVMEQFLSTNDIVQNIYNPNNPKDFGTTKEEKVASIAQTVFSYESSKLADEEDEIDYICAFLENARDFGTTNIQTVDLSDDELNVDALINMLDSMNNSRCLYDCVPNILYYTFDSGEFDLFGDAVNLKNVEPFYIYTKGSQDYTRHYPATELTTLGDIITAYQNFVDVVDNDSITDLFVIKALVDKGYLYDILHSMYSSEMFHKCNSRVVVDGQLTVFEEIMYYMVHESKLDTYTYPTDAKAHVIANLEKVTNLDLTSGINETGYHNQWDSSNDFDELHSFIKFVKDGQEYLGNDGVLDFSHISFGNAAPELVSNLMRSLNHVDFLSDALPVFIEKGFTELGLNDLASYNGVAYTKYNLGQYGYSGPRGGSDKYELDYIEGALKNLYITKAGTASYAHLSNIVEFGQNVDSFEGVMDFIMNGRIFNTKLDGTYNEMNEVEGYHISARGALLHNVFDAAGTDPSDGAHLSSYITGSSEIEKIAALSKIFTFENMSVANESKGLLTITRHAGSLDENSLDPTNFTKVANVAMSLKELGNVAVDADGNNGKSYIAYEIISSILDEVVENQATSASLTRKVIYGPSTVGTDCANIVPANYNSLTKAEAQSVFDACELFNLTKDIIGGYASTAYEYTTMVNKLDGSEFARVMFGSQINPLLGLSVDVEDPSFTWSANASTLCARLGLSA